MVRPRVPMLSVEKIALAALEQIDATGDFSIPLLADRLEVGASSLYHHVDGRAGIIEAVRQHLSAGSAGALLAEPGQTVEAEPEAEPAQADTLPYDLDQSDWRVMLRHWARAYVVAMSAHPLAVPLMVRQPVNNATALDIYESAAQVFTAAGFTSEQAIVVMTFIENFAIGTAVDEAAPDVPWAGDPERHVALTAALGSVPPRARGMLAFEFALDAVVAAMERILEQSPQHNLEQ
ncbi:TetR/AcrR family transcriptional regulator C-terminal domain-containing protein [Pseudoclavibacter helvolus]|uniref:AcrR family transcriptional regulator n=1 Tax=Pseudoclavibacter helvolus TaxID=255205 RepID=A0A7W4UNS9_9MICO|nr:TetR/AcrR family transcriptional regulator C-terminal domain-containing protein [Pseudoclavibacter helvolus]MBB2957892.1 AcrR family transcriptional regulator [Pseudoclavibacter helvolus]